MYGLGIRWTWSRAPILQLPSSVETCLQIKSPPTVLVTFFFAELKHHERRGLTEERGCVGLWFQRDRLQQQGRHGSWQPEQEAERLHLQSPGESRENEPEMGQGYKLWKATLSDTLPPQDPTSSKSHQLPKTMPLPGDLVASTSSPCCWAGLELAWSWVLHGPRKSKYSSGFSETTL